MWVWIAGGAISVIVAINIGVVAVTAGISRQPRRLSVNSERGRSTSLAILTVLGGLAALCVMGGIAWVVNA